MCVCEPRRSVAAACVLACSRLPGSSPSSRRARKCDFASGQRLRASEPVPRCIFEHIRSKSSYSAILWPADDSGDRERERDTEVGVARSHTARAERNAQKSATECRPVRPVFRPGFGFGAISKLFSHTYEAYRGRSPVGVVGCSMVSEDCCDAARGSGFVQQRFWGIGCWLALMIRSWIATSIS